MGQHRPPDQDTPESPDQEHEEGYEPEKRDQDPASDPQVPVGVHEKVVRIYGGSGSASHHDEGSGEGEQVVRGRSVISIAGTALLAALGIFTGVGIGYYMRCAEEPPGDPRADGKLRVLKGGKK